MRGAVHGCVDSNGFVIEREAAARSVVVVIGEREHGIDQREDQRGHLGSLAGWRRGDQSGVAPLGLLGWLRGRC